MLLYLPSTGDREGGKKERRWGALNLGFKDYREVAVLICWLVLLNGKDR